MFAFIQERKRRNGIARLLYDSILAQSRQPVFYKEKGVPDTVTGRFELVVLHAFLVWQRLSIEGKQGEDLSQALFDIMFRDMSDALRNIGIGDLGIPHHVKRMMRGYKGRAMAYKGALETDGLASAQTEQVLRRNLFATVPEPDPAHIRFFREYIYGMKSVLAAHTKEEILNGNVNWKREGNEWQEEGRRAVA